MLGTAAVSAHESLPAAQLLAAQQSKAGSLMPLLLIVGLGLFTYVILIRPQRNRMKNLQATQASLNPGAEVMTTAGLYATVVDFDEESVTLETAPGVHNRYARAAVARIISPTGDDEDEAAAAEDRTSEAPEEDLEEGDDDTPHDATRRER